MCVCASRKNCWFSLIHGRRDGLDCVILRNIAQFRALLCWFPFALGGNEEESDVIVGMRVAKSNGAISGTQFSKLAI